MAIKIAAASVIGLEHRQTGILRQDRFMTSSRVMKYGFLEIPFNGDYDAYVAEWDYGDGYAILAVADGLSSARLSHIAASIAAKVAINSVNPSNEGTLIDAIKAVIRAIKNEANRNRLSIKDFETTLAIGLMRNNECFGIGIGDSYVVAINGESPKLISSIMKGENPNETIPITSSLLNVDELSINKSDCTALVVMSDGIMGSLQAKYDQSTNSWIFEPYQKFYIPLMRKLNDMNLEEYGLWLLNYLRRLEDLYSFMTDDKTLAIAVQT